MDHRVDFLAKVVTEYNSIAVYAKTKSDQYREKVTKFGNDTRRNLISVIRKTQ